MYKKLSNIVSSAGLNRQFSASCQAHAESYRIVSYRIVYRTAQQKQRDTRRGRDRGEVYPRRPRIWEAKTIRWGKSIPWGTTRPLRIFNIAQTRFVGCTKWSKKVIPQS